ncbi:MULTISPECIES: alpha/beta fold hydrolase [unclassified Crossiella]|uniref:alpha/beta fold hydrolase n=1 Tax=unclassified Crossiella TaxID=2620835 RepID=UPI002000271B|nr:MULTISPECIES: alpha/beta hydrolase [unclassified Crossiella]MCK2239959.1 alpha/beta hydrolase [Crossiella sp. S99.2]MCK2252667.1 alpha/beta hydrolase [Crossiella sp. S99.1]
MISRKQFTRALAATAAIVALASCAPAGPSAQPPPATASAVTGNAPSWGPIKQIKAGVLDIGYAETGPANGKPVILLHGWPYDIHSYVDVAPALAAAGFRVFVPYLRGSGSTTFLSPATVRNGQQAAVATDIINFMDALGIQRATIAGFDWGARTATVLAALWPDRFAGLVSVSGYLITNLKANQQPLPPAAELGWWYQYYFATERGVQGYTRNRTEFNKLIWQGGSPKWQFDDATYQRTAQSFANPDHVAIVVHNYRWRLSLAPGEPQYEALEQKLAAAPMITIPAITIASDFDGAAANGAGYRDKFTGRYDHRVLPGIGHNVPQEAPREFTKAVIDVTG